MELKTREVKFRKGQEGEGEVRYTYTYPVFTDWDSVDLGEVVEHVKAQYPTVNPEATALRILNEGLRAYAAQAQDPNRPEATGRVGRGMSLSTFVARINDPETPDAVKVRLREMYPEHVEALRKMFGAPTPAPKPTPSVKAKGRK